MVETLSEDEADSADATPVGILTYVLGYDDLLADEARALPPLGRELSAIEIRRATEGSRLRLQAGMLLIPDQYVSSLHARVHRRGVLDILKDLDSKHGTVVNRQRVRGEHLLCDGDMIEVGHSLLCYRRIGGRHASPRSEGSELRLGPTRTLSPEVARLILDLERIAPTDQPVLLLGETGTGKEIAARHVHERSGRPGPLVAIDCGAIPEQLIESDLFGHRRGAFSGASEERKGRLRSADRGSVFLDEIANMSEAAQARLLRVVQDRLVVPVGSDRGQMVDIRWIAATNADVFAEKAAFRADLRERLAGYVGALPPLRRRREDLGILAAYLLANAGFRRVSIRKEAGRELFSGALTGNVRELDLTLRRAAALAGGDPIEKWHLSRLAAHPLGEPSGAPPDPRTLDTSAPPVAPKRRARPSRAEILDALKLSNGVQGDAARRLGVHERQLARWMDALAIPRARSNR